MTQEEMLELIAKISPHAKDYVYNSIENVEVLYSIHNLNNKGVFIKVDNEDCCIFYASFLNDENVNDLLDYIMDKTNDYISKNKSKEICFNVLGSNVKIIDLVRKLGFKSDMEGYHLEYRGNELNQLNIFNLTIKGFDDSMIKKFVNLFDSAYYELNIHNGWETDSHAKNQIHFHQELNNMNIHNQVYSFWLDDALVGAYIFQQNYITDIVVSPKYQNQGYGTYILAHCIRTMRGNKSIDKIRLRVTKSNIGAKKLYERNDFVEIAYFAEHTYDCNYMSS
jgi:GNAT superfamily N-acetyltransferase